jgi:hypothetical protein
MYSGVPYVNAGVSRHRSAREWFNPGLAQKGQQKRTEVVKESPLLKLLPRFRTCDAKSWTWSLKRSAFIQLVNDYELLDLGQAEETALSQTVDNSRTKFEERTPDPTVTTKTLSLSWSLWLSAGAL